MDRKSLSRNNVTRIDFHLQNRNCPYCGTHLPIDYVHDRIVQRLDGKYKAVSHVAICVNTECVVYKQIRKPESEVAFVLPHHEFGLDVINYIGFMRYKESRSVPTMHEHLRNRGLEISKREVTYLLDRYDELLSIQLKDNERLNQIIEKQKKVILAVDGIQPEKGNEVLWVVRDTLSGEILSVRSILSSRQEDLISMFKNVKGYLTVPIDGIISDGEHSLRKAIDKAFPGIPHQLCQFHYLKDAAKEAYEADRHAKREIKKKNSGNSPN